MVNINLNGQSNLFLDYWNIINKNKTAEKMSKL